MTWIVTALSTIGSIVSNLWNILTTVSSYVGEKLKTLSELVRYQQLSQVHKIAILVSSEYRKLWAGIYNEMADFSRAIGVSADMLALALRNAQTVLHTAGAMAGKSYEDTEVEYLSKFSSWLRTASYNARYYQNNPGKVFSDIDSFLVGDAPRVDFFAFNDRLNKLAAGVEKIGTISQQLTDFQVSLTKFRDDLPAQIRGPVEIIVGPLITAVSAVNTKEVQTLRYDLSNKIDAISRLSEKEKQRTQALIDRLKMPADYLGEIDALEAKVRQEQLEKLGRLSSEASQTQAIQLTDYTAVSREEFLRLKDNIQQPIEPAAWQGLEADIPSPRQIGFPEKTKTWYVGDF